MSPSQSSSRSSWWTSGLAFPVLTAVVVRGALLAIAYSSLAAKGISPLSRGDTPTYLEAGRNLLFTGAFSVGGLPYLYRTPGYSLFLALATLPGPLFAALLQVLLSALTVVLVWRLARAVFDNERIAFLAGWLFVFEPLSMMNSVLLQAETVFLVLFLLSLDRLVRFLRGTRLRDLALAGLFLAAATMVRPVTYYLPIFLGLGFAIVLPGSLRWKAPAVLLLSVLPWLAAWQIRNWIETGYSGFTSITITNPYDYEAAEVLAMAEHKPFVEVQREIGYGDWLTVHPDQAAWSEPQRLAYMHEQTVRILRRYPKLFLISEIKGFFRVTFSPATTDLISQMALSNPQQISTLRERIHDQGPLRAALAWARANPWDGILSGVIAIWLLILYVFLIRGVLRSSVRDPVLWLLIGVSFYMLGVSSGAQAGGRYRMPVMPIVCVLAAAGFQRRPALVGPRSDSSNPARIMELS